MLGQLLRLGLVSGLLLGLGLVSEQLPGLLPRQFPGLGRLPFLKTLIFFSSMGQGSLNLIWFISGRSHVKINFLL